jgi:formylglycine-generating enzyme required for sulfatase activity
VSRTARLPTPAILSALCVALAWQPPLGESAPAPLLSKRFTNSIGMKLVRISAGKFKMGSPAGEEGRRTDEHQHVVEITRPFYLGVYTVTQAQYKKVMGTNPSHFSATGPRQASVRGLNTDDFPVENVSWHDTVAFCKKLSARPAEKAARRFYRLPTEAEWEYACRAGTTTAYHTGKTLEARQANISGSSVNRVSKVGSYKPNAWGLYDVHGNVWQFCSDWYGDNYYRVSPRKDPPGPRAGTYRVARAGCWHTSASFCRSAARTHLHPSTRYYTDVSFRVACDVGGRR